MDMPFVFSLNNSEYFFILNIFAKLLNNKVFSLSF